MNVIMSLHAGSGIGRLDAESLGRSARAVENAEASVSAGSVKASGHLRVSAPAGFGRRHIAPLIPAFSAAHPGVTVSLDLTDRLVERRIHCTHFVPCARRSGRKKAPAIQGCGARSLA